MSAQTDTHVRWLVFLSCLTPEWFRAEMARLSESCARFEPVYLDDRKPYAPAEEGDVLALEIARRRNPECGYVLTMRIDNDDAVNVRFCERVRQAAVRALERGGIGGCLYLLMPNGCAYDVTKTSLQRWYNPDGHFPALLAAADSSEHVMRLSHSKIRKCGCAITLVEGSCQWLEVVHGGNQHNRFHPHLSRLYRSEAWMQSTFGIRVPVGWWRFVRAWTGSRLRAMARKLAFGFSGKD